MVASWAFQQLNQWLGPAMLRSGLKLRYTLLRGVVADSPLLDAITLLPIAQRLISIEVNEEIQRRFHGGKTGWSQFGEKAEEDASIKSPLDVLERHLRPALVPSEQWRDVMLWQMNARLLKWARYEFLNIKYNKQVTQAREHLSELPSSGEISYVLGTKHWTSSTDRKPNRGLEKIATKLGGEVVAMHDGIVEVIHVADTNTSTKYLSFEELLESAGGFIMDCGPLNAYCEREEIWQVWSKEYVEKLGHYLLDKTKNHKDGKTVVIDVGAGDGRLAQALRSYMETHQQSLPPGTETPTVVATDDDSWGLKHAAPVECLTVFKALLNYGITANIDGGGPQQTIVICSWMPMGEDWSKLFREFGVDEYILIGESDDGQCGDNWETWGNTVFHPDTINTTEEKVYATSTGPFSEEEKSKRPHDAPFQLGGYSRLNMNFVLPFQFSRFDSRSRKTGRTVLFRRG